MKFPFEIVSAPALTVSDIVHAVWKKKFIILIISLIFAMIGLVVGYFYASHSNFEGGFKADKLEIIAFSNADKYWNKIMKIEQSYVQTSIYFGEIESKASTADPMVFDPYKDTLDNFKLQVLVDLKSFYYLNRPISLADKKREIDRMYLGIENTKESIVKAEVDSKTLANIMGPVPSDPATIQPYSQLLTSAAALGTLRLDLLQYEERLNDILKSSDEEIASIANEMESMIGEACSQLELINEDVYNLAQWMAENDGLEIRAGVGVNTREPGEFSVEVIPSSHQDSFESQWLAVTIISLLLGFIVSSFLSIYKYGKSMAKCTDNSNGVEGR